MSKDSRQPAYPKLKVFFDMLFLLGVILLVVKLGVLAWSKLSGADMTLPGGSLLWNFGPLALMIGAGIGSSAVKDKDRED